MNPVIVATLIGLVGCCAFGGLAIKFQLDLADARDEIDLLRSSGRVTYRVPVAEASEIADMLDSLHDLYCTYHPAGDEPFTLCLAQDIDRVAHFRDLFRQHAR